MIDWTLLVARFWAFVGKFPSIVVESVSGLLCVGLCAGAFLVGAKHPLIALFLGANALSFAYETKLDANGFSWSDVGQREVGILLGLAVASLFHF
jgi:hypothetical protein